MNSRNSLADGDDVTQTLRCKPARGTVSRVLYGRGSNRAEIRPKKTESHRHITDHNNNKRNNLCIYKMLQQRTESSLVDSSGGRSPAIALFEHRQSLIRRSRRG